jgi:phosphoserine phosphatase
MGIELIFFDMEGTIFAKQASPHRGEKEAAYPGLWSRLMSELGTDAMREDAETIRKWESGEYSTYLDWVDESIRILQQYGLTKPLFDRIVESVPYNPGVEETFRLLTSRGVKTALVSGGFIEQAKKAQVDLRITHIYSAADLYWDKAGHLIHWNMFPSDFEGKVDFVRLLMREYKLTPEQCGFVGDGKNDVFIAKEVGTSFAYQAHKELRAVATYEIQDFSEILSFI